jgi:hypothetical protein
MLLDAAGLSAHRKLMGERQSVQRVKAERRDDVPKFMQHRADLVHAS